MFWTAAVDLIGDVEGAAAAVGDGDFALLRGL